MGNIKDKNDKDLFMKLVILVSVIFLIAFGCVSQNKTDKNDMDNNREIAEQNIKDYSKYASKEAFLISDEEWQRVLTLVPVAVWSENNKTNTHPFLIFHSEKDGFDIDSAYYFFKKYKPGRINYFEELNPHIKKSMEEFNLNRKDNALDYWKKFKDVVYADGYEASLPASVYASHINAPLIIKRYNDNIDLSKKNTICVGHVSSRCNISYSAIQLQQKYARETGTDKIILVNPDDINKEHKSFKGEKPITLITKKGSTVVNFFSKTSLAAPALAASKKEAVVFSDKSNMPVSISDDIKKSLENLKIKPNYLTIIASPYDIPISERDDRGPTKELLYRELDNSLYGDTDGDSVPDMATGRIYGITISDTSALVAKSIFYKELNPPKKALFLWAPDFLDMLTETYESDSWSKKIGYVSQIDAPGNLDCNPALECLNRSFDIEKIKDASLISYQSHGQSTGGAFNLNTPTIREIELNSPIFITSACSTCAFDKISEQDKGQLFCLNILRNGGVAYIGAVEDAASNVAIVRRYLPYLYSGRTLGEAMRYYKISSDARNKNMFSPDARTHDQYFILIGDPTIVFTDNRLSSLQLQENISYDAGEKIIRLSLPPVTNENKLPFGYHLIAAGRYFNGNFYFDDKTGSVISSKVLIGEGGSGGDAGESRSYIEYLFSVPLEINKIDTVKIEYENGQKPTKEIIYFVKDKKGNTWFSLEEVLYDIHKTNGVPARKIIIKYS